MEGGREVLFLLGVSFLVIILLPFLGGVLDMVFVVLVCQKKKGKGRR
jgi:hypothetical protein